MKSQRHFTKIVRMIFSLLLVVGTFTVFFEMVRVLGQSSMITKATSVALKKAEANIEITINGILLKEKAFTVKGKINGVKQKIIYIPAKEVVEACGGSYTQKGKKVTIAINDVKVTFKTGKTSYMLIGMDKNTNEDMVTLKCGKSVKRGDLIYIPKDIIEVLFRNEDNTVEFTFNKKKKTLNINFEDAVIKATEDDVFKEKVMIRVTSADGGTIPAGLEEKISGEYMPGEKVSIIARSNPGYIFKCWISSENKGEFLDPKSAQTSFIVPNSDCIVTATFEEIIN